MAEKKPWYELITTEIFTLIESGSFKVSSLGCEVDGAVIGAFLRVLKNASDIPVDAAHRIAHDLRVVRRELGDSRMSHLGRLAEETIDDLALRGEPSNVPRQLAWSSHIADDLGDPKEWREADREMEDPLNSERYGPKSSSTLTTSPSVSSTTTDGTDI